MPGAGGGAPGSRPGSGSRCGRQPLRGALSSLCGPICNSSSHWSLLFLPRPDLQTTCSLGVLSLQRWRNGPLPCPPSSVGSHKVLLREYVSVVPLLPRPVRCMLTALVGSTKLDLAVPSGSGFKVTSISPCIYFLRQGVLYLWLALNSYPFFESSD